MDTRQYNSSNTKTTIMTTNNEIIMYTGMVQQARMDAKDAKLKVEIYERKLKHLRKVLLKEQIARMGQL